MFDEQNFKGQLFEVLIGADDLDNEDRMATSRLSLDAGAKASRPKSALVHEEITAYRPTFRNHATGKMEKRPETADTKKYRVLKRFYA